MPSDLIVLLGYLMKEPNEDSRNISWQVIQKFTPWNIYDTSTVVDDYSDVEDYSLSIEAYQDTE